VKGWGVNPARAPAIVTQGKTGKTTVNVLHVFRKHVPPGAGQIQGGGLDQEKSKSEETLWRDIFAVEFDFAERSRKESFAQKRGGRWFQKVARGEKEEFGNFHGPPVAW